MMTKIDHPAFAHPEIGLRKMSMKTVINNQIQIMNRKNTSIEKSTSNNGTDYLFLGDQHSSSPARFRRRSP